MKNSKKIVFNDDLGVVELPDRYKNIKTIEFSPVIYRQEEVLDYTKLLNI
jgi:hypothetical protein